ncbi:hypothetical protein EJB05_13291, partial [Eragrostis curvula]
MARPGQSMSKRRQPWVAPGDGVDSITGLPMDLRARIASFLPFRQVGQLSSLSRPWRRIHDHTPVVQLKLDDFLSITDEMLDEEDDPLGILDEDALAALEAALLRRAEEGTGSSKVDVLRISYSPDDLRIRRHADRIIALADAREICVKIPNSGRPSRVAWTMQLPPSTRDLEVIALHYLAPTIDGPGAAVLETLRLENMVVSHWPCLPSLLSMRLDTVTIEAPFPPGAWCPLLEDLCISVSEIVPVRMDIRLPLLKILELDDVNGPHMDVTVIAPELEELDVNSTLGCNEEFRSFTLRAPRLRSLRWWNQFTERVDIDVGRPGSVTEGIVQFTWNGGFECRDMKDCLALMMRMLNGLLPVLPPDQLTNELRPYITLDKYTVRGFDAGELVREEKLTCDLDAVMSSLQV